MQTMYSIGPEGALDCAATLMHALESFLGAGRDPAGAVLALASPVVAHLCRVGLRDGNRRGYRP